ncbi:hypothetical protein C5S31_12365 [ANME-1 cluster archaeon GoMg2]|nr:hypothetical protein [ANME-1 cluster archaeon GoMg2]
MKGRGIFIAAILVISAFALTGVSAAEKVDLFLILDGSNSISPANYSIQLNGYADAISNSSVTPQNGDISVCVIMFGYFPPNRIKGPRSPPYYANVEVPLTTITNQTVADSIADTILAMPQPGDHTPMPRAFTLANETLTDYVTRGNTSPNVRQIIDISTDGRPNWICGGNREEYQPAVDATYEARDDAIFKGYFDEVNVLGVDVIDEAHPPAQPYNREFLVKLNYSLKPANHSGFYMEAPNWEAFPEAIKEKMQRELKPHVSITKNVSKPTCNCSDVLSYTITYRNDDNEDLTEVILTDPIPTDTTLVDGSISGGGKVDVGRIVWNIGNLLIGAEGTQSFDVTVHDYLTNNTLITNTATIDTNETEPKNASVNTTVLVLPSFELSAYKTVDKSFASSNDTLSYRIHYNNIGAGTLTNATIHDTIPANTTYISESMGLNGVDLTDAADDDAGTYYPVNNTLIWDIGTLASGVGGDATFKAKINAFVPAGTVINNTAILTTDETEPIDRSAITKIRGVPELPVLMPVGIAALIGLLSLVAIRGMIGRRR